MGDVLQHHRLARLGRRDDQPALAPADGGDDVDDAPGQVLLGADVALEGHGDVGVERGEVLEEDLVLGVLGRLGVDLVDLDQREVALAVLGRSDLPLDRVAGVQVEAPDLRRAHVDVVGPGQVAGVRGAQEPEPVRQHLQRALPEDAFPLLGLVLQQGEDEVLLAQPVGILDLVGVGHVDELGDVEILEIGKVHSRRTCGGTKGLREEGKPDRRQPFCFGSGPVAGRPGTCARALD